METASEEDSQMKKIPGIPILRRDHKNHMKTKVLDNTKSKKGLKADNAINYLWQRENKKKKASKCRVIMEAMRYPC